MFTGIVEEVGTVKHIQTTARGATMAVHAPVTTKVLKVGDSVATAGTCLTCTTVSHGQFTADLSQQTLNTTTLGSLQTGHKVNLEPALTLNKPLGGHLVQGHVDGVGTVHAITPSGEGTNITFAAPDAITRYIIPKGSITIDGVSLTVADVHDEHLFTVALIPHTLQVTTLGSLQKGHRVNMEADLIGKYVERLLIAFRSDGDGGAGKRAEHNAASLKSLLQQAGFLHDSSS